MIRWKMKDSDYGMYEYAKTIQDLCGSGMMSNNELEVLSQEFFNDYGCDWTEILDK